MKAQRWEVRGAFSRSILLIVILGLVAGSTVPALAGGYLYSGKRRYINCGVLVVNGGAQQPLVLPPPAVQPPIKMAPEVNDFFYILNQQNGLKPSGWSFQNPLAPPGTQPVPYAPATPQTPNYNTYWLVNLDTADLSRMDVLYFPAWGSIVLTQPEREKLREFVDGGGVLWIDNAAGSLSSSTPLDFTDSQGNGTFFINPFRFGTAAPGGETAADRHHPLISSPYWLQDQEISSLGLYAGQSYCVPGADYSSTFSAITGSGSMFFDGLLPVVNQTGGANLPDIAAGVYGSGRIVATSDFVGLACNSTFSSPYTQAANLKFAYNVIAWAASSTTLRKDYRHSGSSIDTLGGTELSQSWYLPLPGAGLSPNAESGAVVYKNVAFYTSNGVGGTGAGTVYATDVFPTEDLDNDGNPDDGLQDMQTGVNGQNGGQDLIWQWTNPDGDQLSAPTVVSIVDPSSAANGHPQTIDVVLVESDKNVYVLDAFPHDPTTGVLLDRTREITSYALQGNSPVPGGRRCPPIYVNGWIYACTTDGYLNAFNTFNPSPGPTWTIPTISNGSAPFGSSVLRAGPCYGFVKDSNTGAITGMVYWFTDPWNSSQVSGQPNEIIEGVPVFVGSERAKIIGQSGNTTTCVDNHQGVTMYPPAGSSTDPTALKSMVSFDPHQFTGSVTSVTLDPTQLGHFTIQTTTPLPPNAVVYVSYGLDYSQPSGNNIVRNASVSVALPPSAPTNSGITPPLIAGTPAMGQDNTIYLNGKPSGTKGAIGTIYGLSNDGNSSVPVNWCYYLHNGYLPSGGGPPVVPPGGSGAEPVLPVIVNTDPSVPLDQSVLQNAVPSGSPAISKGKLFVTVSSGSDTDPKGALLCFKANPDFVVRIDQTTGFDKAGNPIKTPMSLYNNDGSKMNVRIWQPDPTFSDSSDWSAVPTDVSGLVDYDHGTITFTNFAAHEYSDNQQSLTFGYSNMFTPSLPVWVFLNNVEVPIDWSTWGPAASLANTSWAQNAGYVLPPARSADTVDLSQWNNLLWYYVDQNSTISSPPTVVGNTVFFTDDNGTLYALDADPGQTQGGQVTKCLWQQKVGATPIPPNQYLGGSISAANGALLVPTEDGLHGLTDSTTLVADNNRIVELDGGGNIAWSVDSISYPSQAPSLSDNSVPFRRTPIDKPTRVSYVNGGGALSIGNSTASSGSAAGFAAQTQDVLVVNSGADQVCKIDRTGAVGMNWFNLQTSLSASPSGYGYIRWMYDKFTDSQHLLAPGQSTTLRDPTDALFWEETEQEVSGNSTVPVTVYHCLIADSGNHRLVDLVYRFVNGNLLALAPPDPTTGFYLPDLDWVTKTSAENAQYVYRCIQLVHNAASNGTPAYDAIWAAVSNYRTGTPDAAPQPQGLGGAIVEIVFRKLASNGAWQYTGPSGGTGASAGPGEIRSCCDRVAGWPDGTTKPLANPRFFQVEYEYDPATSSVGTYLLICDNYGVYKAQIPPAGGVPVIVSYPGVNGPRPMILTDAMYRAATRDLVDDQTGNLVRIPSAAYPYPLGAPLMATSVEDLPGGRWLITNSYSGTDKMSYPGKVYNYAISADGPPNPFTGEVFIYDFNAPVGGGPNEPAEIPWYSPSLVVPRSVDSYGNPTYDPRIRNQRTSNGQILQQPRSAFRQQ